MIHDALAFDRCSVRSYDADGRPRVAQPTLASKCLPYLGREIHDYQALWLDGDREYKLLRHPDELKKAAGSFNNLPLLSKHVPVSAADHRLDLVVGSTGTGAKFDGTYVPNSLIIWAGDAIDAVEDEIQKELSCAYRYRADMPPVTYNSEAYDGIMMDIVGNHVALVEEGRAGPDVVVGDAF